MLHSKWILKEFTEHEIKGLANENIYSGKKTLKSLYTNAKDI